MSRDRDPQAAGGPEVASADAADGPENEARTSGLTRRRVLGLAGGGVAIGAAAAGGVVVGARTNDDRAARGSHRSYPFHGVHQPGIVTPVQDRLHFAAFDVTTESARDLANLMKAWTLAADRMMQGLPAGKFGPVGGPYPAPPDDTGEAMDLPPSGLTITFGFGRSLFVGTDGKDRFGLEHALPEALIDLPLFPADKLDLNRSGGDLCIQACADDPQVAVHAIRNLARIGFGTVGMRWSQLGFGRTSSTSTSQSTPRNLFGFKDGTANIKAEDNAALDEHVWVSPADDSNAQWMAGGSYLVARRINMHIETWDRSSLREQEQIIGRDKGEGAPLSGGTEFAEPDFEFKSGDGTPLIAVDSHVRLAHPSSNGGVQILRRGYNFADGSDGLGRMDAGLFFIAFVRDPAAQFVPMQTALARDDAMSEYLLHTGSALFAVPPGVEAGSDIGSGLFASSR